MFAEGQVSSFELLRLHRAKLNVHRSRPF
jgi:hypothetical protein